MIRYALICNKGHEFESWFADRLTIDKRSITFLFAPYATL
jgi:hypothetical protein